VSLDLSALPRDIDALQTLVQELASALTAEKLHVEQLKASIAQLRRMQFGRSSEKIDL
jgi:predicted RNase H-like nuclease (RuvC/YqgF family)